jgi:type II secretory pathway component GspD/PulD (secretin)
LNILIKETNQMKKAILLLFILFIPLGVLAQNTLSVPLTVDRQAAPNFCDPNFIGEPISFMQTAELTLDDLLTQIHNRYGVNFLIGPNVSKLPINIKSNNIAWNTLLSSQLYLLGVSSTCVNSNTIQLVKNEAVPELEKGRLNSVELQTEIIKLKYLQPTTRGTRNLAGESSGGNGGGGAQCERSGSVSGASGSGGSTGSVPRACTYERLIEAIEKILGLNEKEQALTPTQVVDRADGNQTAFSETGTVTTRRPESLAEVPGRNILIIRGSAGQLAQIKQIIALADRPPFQVVIKGLVYTANETRLRDIGVRTTITATTGNGRTSGGIFGAPISGAGTIFDFSTLIGTFDFNIQASALEQNGVISIKSRPFATVLDGDATALEVGRQIPVLTQGSVVGGSAGDLEFIGASNLLSVTPHVIDDENGNPVAVNLELQLESNDVDTAVISQGLPAVTRRSIQSKLILNQDKTVILGGFTVDSNSDTVSKTPGLGDIPILGYLFKRKVRSDQINRLYFALSVSVVPYGSIIEPVVVPGATTNIPTITPKMLKQSEKGEQTTSVPSSTKDNKQ